MVISAAEIANIIGGSVEGDGKASISSVAKIEEAKAGDLAFLSNPKYIPHLYTTEASVVIISNDMVLEKPVSATLIRHAMPYYGFCIVLDKYFNPHTNRKGIDAWAQISSSAIIGEDVYIGAASVVEEGASIGNNTQVYPQVFVGKGASIGKNCIIYAGVKLYSGCHIGDNCIIHAGTVIGSDGFGFAPTPDGSYAKIPQIGNVIVEDNVEMGANCCIDRATMGSTIIRKGVKLDNMVQVAHNAEVGEHTVIAGQSGVAGSTKVGKHCVIGAQVGIVGHITIAEGSQFGGQSGVPKSIKEPNQQWIGSPVMPLKDAFRAQVLTRNLHSMEQRLTELEKKLKAFESAEK